MWRLTDRNVRSALVTAWFFAGCPVRTSPLRANATTEGVVREPSEFAMTVGSPPSRTATTELVVPRSMPTARAMFLPPMGLLGILSCPGSSSSDAGRGRHAGLESRSLNLYTWPNERARPDVPEPAHGTATSPYAAGRDQGTDDGAGPRHAR